jgi:hypothetical protein
MTIMRKSQRIVRSQYADPFVLGSIPLESAPRRRFAHLYKISHKLEKSSVHIRKSGRGERIFPAFTSYGIV